MVLTCGLLTPVCVLLTTLSATQRGLFAAVVEDCSAGWRRTHQRTLDLYAGNRFFDRVEVASIETMLPRWRARNRKLRRIRGWRRLLAPLG